MELQNYVYELKPVKSLPVPKILFYLVVLIEFGIMGFFIWRGLNEDLVFLYVGGALAISGIVMLFLPKLFGRVKVAITGDNRLAIINPIGSYVFDLNILKKIERQNTPAPFFYFLNQNGKRLGILGGIQFAPSQIIELCEYLKTKVKDLEVDLRTDLFPKDYK